MPIPSCTDDHGRLISIKRRKKPTVLVFLRTQDMRGTQEKIGLLATVTQSTVAHSTHLKMVRRLHSKAAAFFARFSV
jgi:hypothetical protein